MRGFRALLVGNAPEKGVPARLRALKPDAADLLIAVDGGLKHCLAARPYIRMLPDLAIGDFDSFKKSRVPKTVKCIQLATDKDHSDLYYALQTALVIGASEIVAVGFSGGRADHALAALAELSEVSQVKGLRGVRLIGEGETLHFLSPWIPIWRQKLAKGARVSIIALSDAVGGARWRGFRYAPRDGALVLKPGSRGLSNVALGGEASFTLHKGRAVVIVAARGAK